MGIVEWFTRRSLTNLASRADRAETRIDRAVESLHDLEARFERLSFLCRAMWELLREKTDVTEDDLEERIRRLEELEREGRACASCGRPNTSRRSTCLYCGAPLDAGRSGEGGGRG